MAIFRYELRQLRFYTFWWALAVGLSIFIMLPTYMSFLTGGTIDITQMGSNSFFEMLEIDINIITTPLGTYGFLTSFFLIAGGINGMFLGLKTFTKETVQKTADYLYTKPYAKSQIYLAKVTAAAVSLFIVGICYFLGSWGSALVNITEGFDQKALFLMAFSFLLVELYFVLLGALVGVLYSKIRTPFLMSTGVVFLFYVTSTFASKIGSVVFKFVSPYSYFGASKIIGSGSYHTGYLMTFIILCIVFAVVGYGTFTKKDVTFIS